MSYLLYLMFRCDRRCDGCDGKFGNFVGTKHTLRRKTPSRVSGAENLNFASFLQSTAQVSRICFYRAEFLSVLTVGVVGGRENGVRPSPTAEPLGEPKPFLSHHRLLWRRHPSPTKEANGRRKMLRMIEAMEKCAPSLL